MFFVGNSQMIREGTMFVLFISILIVKSAAQLVLPTQISPGINTPSPNNINGTPVSYNYEDEYIERPCEKFDTFCLRKYFKKHSQCKEVYGPVPDPMYRQQFTAYLARVNLTIVFNNVFYTGLNGKIEEFYINKKTNNLVLAVQFNNIGISSDHATFRYHRIGREPTIVTGKVNATVGSNFVTITVPNLKNLQLDEAEVFSFVDSQPKTIYMSPELLSESSPVSTSEFFSGIQINMQESELTESPFFIGSYIQYNICDFGLELR